MPMRFAVLAAVLCLAGCATTQGPTRGAPIDIGALPESVAAPCPPLTVLPTVDTDQQDLTRYYATDRTNYAICRGRQQAVVTIYDTTRQQLAGAKP